MPDTGYVRETPAEYLPAPTDGRRFRNLSGVRQHGFGALLRWLVTRRRAPWPELVENAAAPAPPERVEDGGLCVTPVGHATFLISYNFV